MLLFAGFCVGGLLVRSTNSTSAKGCAGTIGEWHQIYWYSVVLIVTAQMSDTVREFFIGEGPGLWDHLQYFLLGKDYQVESKELGACDRRAAPPLSRRRRESLSLSLCLSLSVPPSAHTLRLRSSTASQSASRWASGR